MDTDAQIYLGSWTNWSQGSAVKGATLTTTREQGNFLIAFTALFVPFVASRFWRIFAILFHQCYSTPNKRDAVHHQRQIVLRNSSSPESAIVTFASMIWAWRREARRSWPRLLPMALFSFLSIGGFTVAGGFSAQISASDEVLLNADDCEAPTAYSQDNSTSPNDPISYWTSFENSISGYAKQCYSNNKSTDPLECSKYVVSNVPTAVMDYNATCPFKSGICRRNSSNLLLDTGHLNSNDIFGINAPRNETFTLRYVLKCAPLATENYRRNLTTGNRTFTAYNYGPGLVLKGSYQPNYTVAVPDIDTQAKYFFTFQGAFVEGLSLFTPDPVVIEPDGDVSLFFLSGNGVYFATPGDDWYRATVPNARFHSFSGNESADTYRPDEAASPLGCIEQYQWCRDPAQGQCGNLEGSTDSQISAAPWFNVTRKELEPDRPVSQTKLGSIIIWAWYALSIDSGDNLGIIINKMGAASLASQEFLSQGLMWCLRKNQWQIDVTQWWNLRLAGFQAKFVNTAQGSKNSSIRPFMIPPANAYEWEVCRNQKIRSTKYANFSILGLILTYALGALIVVISFVIPPILCFLQKRGWYNKYAYLEWEGDTAIQLHRVAHDELGYGHWSRCDETIPITRTDDLLAPFDISDPSHPMLVHIDDNTTPTETSSEEASRHSSSDEETAQESSPRMARMQFLGIPPRQSAEHFRMLTPTLSWASTSTTWMKSWNCTQ
ncbi:hypothetical protein PG996_004965 [Apiospora saccharicola]|uniref:Uncharacterized protein n=1 Tax=Apiospora saccharicola TaxID=335842 RepID=A0ABR1VL88_9PEZI